MYQSLPNKYRPILFKDLVGQEHNQRFFKALIRNGQTSRNIALAGHFGSSKCVTMDTLVYTNKGIIPISEISDNRNPDTFSAVSDCSVCNIDGEMESISQFYYNGVKPCKEIISKRGFTISGTLVHPLLCMNKNTGDLEYVQIGEISKDIHCLVIQTPYMYAERNHKALDKDIYFDVVINKVPGVILQSGEYIQKSFLREYLEFDVSNPRELEYTSDWRVLLQQIQLLLLNFGFLSTISFIQESGRWVLSVGLSDIQKPFTEKGYYFDEIDSISEVFEAEVCDISVDGTHSFNAAGFVSHNTTTARIYARALLCEHPTEDGEPCNQCESCLKSLEGVHPDIMEIDASSKGGKEDIINLVEIAKTPPLFSKHRVIIDDEVQAHSRQAWDALLKLIEEPPPFLTFIFCTTEKDKVRPAILSRCAVRDVNLLDRQKSIEHLKHICDLEGFKYEESALKAIAQVSQGHPRDLLKNLEQVSFLGDISVENTRTVLNDSLIDEVYRFLIGLHKNEDMVGRILMSTIPPSQMYNMVKEVILHFKYNVFQQRGVSFNPLIDMVDPEISHMLFDRIKDTASLKKLSCEDYLDELYKSLTSNGRPEIRSDMVVIAEMAGRYINSTCATESAAKGSNTGSVRRRREFVNSYRKTEVPAPTSVVQESDPPPPPPVTNSGDKVYTHTLMQNGFELEDMDTLEVVEL